MQCSGIFKEYCPFDDTTNCNLSATGQAVDNGDSIVQLTHTGRNS
jgi:hypothetical protein